jgi:hypothetical protein
VINLDLFKSHPSALIRQFELAHRSSPLRCKKFLCVRRLAVHCSSECGIFVVHYVVHALRLAPKTFLWPRGEAPSIPASQSLRACRRMGFGEGQSKGPLSKISWESRKSLKHHVERDQQDPWKYPVLESWKMRRATTGQPGFLSRDR